MQKLNEKNIKINHLDLFSGLGGFSIAVEQAIKLSSKKIEYKCLGFSEIKKHAIKALKENFPEVNNYGDITKIDIEKLPDFNLLTGGFPCQPFSIAGNKQGFQDEKGRGEMFFFIADILRIKKPEMFILENVENLIKHDEGKTLKTIVKILKDLNYIFDFHVFNSSDFNLPQKRKRIFIYGIHKNTNKDFNLLNNIKNFKNNKNYLTYFNKKSLFGDIKENIGIDNIKKSITEKEQKIIEKINHYLMIQSKSIDYLDNKCINDKRGGVNNIHSFDLELFGSVSPLQKKLLNMFVTENRKKENNQFNVIKSDAIPISIERLITILSLEKYDHIYNEIKSLEKSMIKDYKYENLDLIKEILKNELEDLCNKKYLVKYFWVKEKKLNNKTNIKIIPQSSLLKIQKTYKNDDFENNYEILSVGYSVLTNKLRFPYYYFIYKNSQLKTLTATDAIKIGVVQKEEGNKAIIRKLSNNELKRCFGYEDGYKLNNLNEKEIFDLFGNTIPINVATYILLEMFNC